MDKRVKHTPGPWNRNIKPAKKYNTIYAGRNTHVTRLAVEGLSDEEIEANCDLITAAPDLLKACLVFIDKVDTGFARSKESYWQMRFAAEKAGVVFPLTKEQFIEEVAKGFAAVTKEPVEQWREYAKTGVEQLLDDEKIEFGDPSFDWGIQGARVIVEEDISCWGEPL